jgi:hypothetical protein
MGLSERRVPTSATAQEKLTHHRIRPSRTRRGNRGDTGFIASLSLTRRPRELAAQGTRRYFSGFAGNWSSSFCLSPCNWATVTVFRISRA